jgi:hypothetical protein
LNRPRWDASCTLQVTMDGPLAFVWSKIMGGGFRESAQRDLDRLVAIVEQP